VNKIHFALIFTLFTILIASILETQDAFAFTIKYVELVDRDWEDPNNWEPARVPNQDDDILIDAAIAGGGALIVDINSEVTIGPSGSITTDNGARLRVDNQAALLTIQGNYIMSNSLDDLFAREGKIVNDCTGTITLGQGQILAQNVRTGATFTNHGTIEGDLLGGAERSDFNIVIFNGGLFQNSGTFPSPILTLPGGTFDLIDSICFTDVDGDGFDPNVDDCNDDDAKINPDAEEIADGIDNNCNGLVDEDTKKSCEGIKKGNESGNGKRKGHVKAKENNNCT